MEEQSQRYSFVVPKDHENDEVVDLPSSKRQRSMEDGYSFVVPDDQKDEELELPSSSRQYSKENGHT